MSGIVNRDFLPAPAHLDCKGCGKDIVLVTHAQALSVVCPYCLTIMRMIAPGVAKSEGKFKGIAVPQIALGKKGVLDGITYCVVGYTKRREAGTAYTWDEYVLFNPVHGYAFLSEFNGHWNFITYITGGVPVELQAYTRVFNYNNDEYRLYHRYKSEVILAKGEFLWDITSTEKAKVSEYIAPPKMLILEESSREYVWMMGEYLQPAQVQKAFGLETITARQGIGSNQPFITSVKPNVLLKFAVIVGLLFTLLQILFVSFSPDEMVMNQSFALGDSSSATVVSPSFTLNNGTHNLEVRLTAFVSNNWFEADMALINDKTGEEYAFSQGVEYYSGYEGGYSWSEGSTTSEELLTSIPEGTYHLNIVPVNSVNARVSSFSLTLKRGVPVWSVYLFSVIIVALVPLIQRMRISSFETKRWMNSNFSPYDGDE